MNISQSALNIDLGDGHSSVPDGTDWWDMDTGTSVDFTSLPLDRWNPNLPHNTGSCLT